MKIIHKRELFAYLGMILTSAFLSCRASAGDAGLPADKITRMEKAFDQYCFVCHPVNPPEKNGPPLFAVAGHYFKKYPEKADYVQAVKSFTAQPQKEKSLMPDELEMFGLMPKMDFPESALEDSAELMWFMMTAETLLPERFQRNKTDVSSLADGGKLFIQNCGACHSIDPPPLNGPPARGMNRHYTQKYPEFTAFSNALISFVKDPKPEKALLKHAVDNFGPMPRLNFREEDLAAIAHWIWQNF